MFYLDFQKKEQLTKDIHTFYFKKNGAEKEFKPGQYFEIKLEIKNPDDRGDARVFTISSSPTNKDYMTVTTRIIESSFKQNLFNLKPGTIVRFDGPWDDLEIDLEDHHPKVFLAGGIGVTPFHSIVQYCLDTNLNIPISLFNSWSKKEEMIFYEFFTKAEKKLPQFKYIPTITQDEGLDAWSGERGRINQSVIERHVVNVGVPTYYIVGPGRFTKGMESLLLEMSVPQEKIVFEDFAGY